MKTILKKSISIFLTLLILLTIAPVSVLNYVFAADGTIEWTFDGENLLVSGTGELSSAYTSTEEWKNMQDKCVNVTIEGEIKIIGDSSFRDFTALKRVEVASEIITVGAYAFSGCTALEEIVLPDSVTKIDAYAFSGCTALKDFRFPQNLVKINEWAFKGCNCFDGKALILPDTLKKVALGAFSGADITSLTAPFVGLGPIDWEGCGGIGTDHIGFMFGNIQLENTYWCSESIHRQSYYVPESLTEVTITKRLWSNNFENVTKIEKIVIKDTVETNSYPGFFATNCTSLKYLINENPDAVTWIGSSAFRSCSLLLENFEIPKNVTYIGDKAFAYGTFDYIEIPDKVETIGQYAFMNCKNLQSIVIPDSVKTMFDYVFKDCSNLKYVELPDNIQRMGMGVFEGTPYIEGITDEFIITEGGVLIEYLGTDTDVVVPANVKRIGSAFAGKSFIKSITLPDGLLYISNEAFRGCCGIIELVVPDSVIEIRARAFAGMCNLEKLTVPFIGKNREAVTDTEESLISYWFDSEVTHKSCNTCSGFYTYVKQIYNNTNYARRAYKPTSLKEITVTDSVIRSASLSNFEIDVLILGANVDGIEKYAADKSGIKELHIDPNINIPEIPDYAFSNNNLTSITIPGGIKRIGKAFVCDKHWNNQITEINLNEGLEIIEGSFVGAKITSIDLPDSLIKIRSEAFRYCGKLKSIEFPSNLTHIGRRAFEDSGLETIVFSDSITDIDYGAFWGCPVKKIVAPESLKGIVEETFKYCEDLEIVVIGGSVTEIGSGAFENCTSLGTVVIPDSVTYISDDAFMNASENMVIYCNEGSYAQEYAIQNNIKYTTLVLDAIPNQTYTGKAIEPVVKAKANNRQLVLNTEYKLSYSDNINVGVAGVTAKGLGDFKHLVAKGKFNILARQLANVTVNYQDFAIYSPNGIEPEISIYIGNEMLSEGVDYEIIGLDKINGVGTYNIAIKGKGNLIGTQNLTLDVLPRNIAETRIITIGGLKITDSGYTLVEGVDYKVEERTKADGDKETYVVGIGNYSDEKKISTTESSSETNIILKIFELIKNFFSKIFGVFK